jgi:hypothetical protein
MRAPIAANDSFSDPVIAAMRCVRCAGVPVSIIALPLDGSLQSWCSPICAREDGWPFLPGAQRSRNPEQEMPMARKPASRKNGAHIEPPTPEPIDASPIEMAVDTLSGDMRDFILDRLRHEQNKRPWHERSEAEQRDTIHAVEAHVQSAIRQAVELIAAQGLKTMRATLEQVVVKDGLKATLTMSKHDESRHQLLDSTGATVLVVVADPEEFTGERAPVAVKPDQSTMLGDNVMAQHSEPNGHTAPFN